MRLISRKNKVVVSPEYISSYPEFIKYILDTGRLSDDYDYKAFYNNKDAYSEWYNQEIKTPGMAHFLGRYKQPWHITYEGTNGENWKQENGQWHYYVPEDHMNYTYDQYVDYWNRNEPNSVLHYGNKQYVVKK